MYQTIIVGIYGFNIQYNMSLDTDVINEDEAVGRNMKKFKALWPDHKIIISSAKNIENALIEQGWKKEENE